MTNDVAIIGVGLHPFGRFDKTAMEMGADAIQAALTDAGVEWKDIQFGFGGSHEVSNPCALCPLLPSSFHSRAHTGTPIREPRAERAVSTPVRVNAGCHRTNPHA